MAATNQDLKDFFALTGNNPAITNGQLVRLQAAVEAQFIDPPTIDADWLVDFLYQKLRDAVVAFEQDRDAGVARQAVTF